MKWYHFTVEYFEDLRNVNHCEFLIMRKQENAKYLLENKLRTWSELRRERALAGKEKAHPDGTKLERNKSIVVSARRWGGCPHGCNHGTQYKRRDDLEILRQKDLENTAVVSGTNGNGSTETIKTVSTTIASRRQQHQRGASSDEDDSEDPRAKRTVPALDVERATELVSSPDGTPSFISPEDRLRILKYPSHHVRAGRDFGGTYSGRTSQAGSDTDASEDERRRTDPLSSLHGLNGNGNGRGTSATADGLQNGESALSNGQALQDDDDDDRVRKHALANRLGDAGSDNDAENRDLETEDLDRAEAEDRSIRGSVY